MIFCKLSFVRLFLYSGKVKNFKPIEKYKTKSRMSWIGLKNFYHQIIAIWPPSTHIQEGIFIVQNLEGFERFCNSNICRRVETFVKGTIVQGDRCPRRCLFNGQRTVVQGTSGPRRFLSKEGFTYQKFAKIYPFFLFWGLFGKRSPWTTVPWT